MSLIHDPNTTLWKPGDLVIHDSDAKRADMLMIVLGKNATGVFHTRYAFPWAQPRPWRRKIWRNTVEWLHDPARFGITAALLHDHQFIPVERAVDAFSLLETLSQSSAPAVI
jgi:hypothetical protein